MFGGVAAMSKVIRPVATVLGAAALIATGLGAFGVIGAGLAAGISTAAGIANVAAQLTAPRPIARGSPTRVVIDVEPPRPYIVGRVMTGGTVRYDDAYGATLKKVPNPYLWQVRVLSGGGGIQGIVSHNFDFAPVGSFYNGFFASVQSLGERPQATALVPPYGAAPGWTTASRISGCAHVGLNFLYDREGKRFASGLPVYTALCDGEKAYDPRLDSTFPGGSGSHRANDESTWTYSGGNPAIEAGTYALGRFENGKRVFGLGQSPDAIDWAAIVDWANDCDTNEWTANVLLSEGGIGADLREQRVRNMDDLCAAGAGRWYQAGGLLSFDWQRPRVPLATLTDEDILVAGGGTDAVPTVRDRMNGVRPQYIDPASNWQMVTADEIIGSTYRTEDGEPLTQVWPLNAVTNAAQAGELAAYAMADSREIGPMDLSVRKEWRFYRPGDCITVDSSLVAYQGQAVINQRGFSPANLDVALQLKSETPAKHDFALGKVANPPPTPTLGQTAEEKDLLAAAALTPRAVDVQFEDDQTLEDLKPGEAGSTRDVPRGTYDAGTTYTLGDIVIFNGSSYKLIVASSVGNAPPDALRWALIAAAGSGMPGDDGLEGITLTVTNESHVVATDKDGNGGVFTNAGGTFSLRRGTTVLTPTFSIAATTPASPAWITIDSSTGVYTVTEPGTDDATATLRANWVGVNYEKTYTLSKSKQGTFDPVDKDKLDGIEGGSTRNEDGGGNMIREAVSLSGANYSNGAGFSTSPGLPTAQLVNGANSNVVFGYVPVRAGEDIHFGFSAHVDASNADSIRGGVNWLDAAGNPGAPVDLPNTAMAGTEGVGLANEVTKGQTIALPPTAVQAQLYVIRPTWGGAGSFFVRRPIMLRAEPGSTKGAPAGTNVAGVLAQDLVSQAAAAEADAAAAQADADAANAAIDNISSDNVLSIGEKPAIRLERDTILDEYPTIRARAVAFGVSVSAFDTRYTDLTAYLGTLALDSATNTAITRSLFNERFRDYYDARQDVLDGVAAAAAAQAQWTGVTGRPESLAQLDPTARAELDSAVGQTRQTVGFQQIITRSLENGGTNNMNAQVARLAGGNSGTIFARIEQRQLGDTTWITVATGPGSAVSASEPGADNFIATFTNTTGAKRAFEFRVTEVRTPVTAGGALVASETFLEA